MAFNVNLYAFSKEVNSTKRPTGSGTEYSCVSNDDLDTLHPRIPLNIGAAANPSAYNYMYIASFSRYYWIRKWTYETGLWVAYCDVDPLASWKSQIGATSAYVLRAAAASNGDLIDTMYPFETDYTYSYDTEDPGISLTNNIFVVGIVGSGATQFYSFTENNLTSFLNYLFSDAYATAALGQLALTMNPELKVALNPMQYITSIVRIPLDISLNTNVSTIKVGLVDVSCSAANTIPHYTRSASWTLQRHPSAASRGSWLNSSGANYILSYPGFGSVKLDPVTIANSTTLSTQMIVDTHTGQAKLLISASSKYIGELHAQLGMSYPIGNSVSPGWGLSSAINTFGSAGAAIVSGRFGSAIGALIGGISDAASAEVPKVSAMGGVSSSLATVGMATLYYEWKTPAPEDNAHRGRPLCAVRTLSTLSGYQLCTNTDVSIPATREEIDMIRGYLESGYYYE